MASRAFVAHLVPQLNDVEELLTAHARLTGRRRGRQWGVGSLNRAIVVIAVSSWEAYLEHVTEESTILLNPPIPPLASWPALVASAKSAIGRFHNPSADNVKNLLRDCLGIPDISNDWHWRNCNHEKAVKHLNELLKLRHQIAHGATPRPRVRNDYASSLPHFIKNLAKCTDDGIKQYLEATFGLQNVF